MKHASIAIIASLLAATGLHAGSPAIPDAMPAAVESEWRFRFAPYAWLTAIDGDIGIGPITAPVDTSFSDTLNDLDMAYMFQIEAGYGRWSLTADFVYGDFSNDIAGAGQPFSGFRYEYTQLVFTPTVGYRVIETDRYSMEVTAGARVTNFDTTLTGRFAAGGQIVRGADDTWTDPIIGIRGQAGLSERFFLRYIADIGGFGVGSDLVWQAFLGLGYRIGDNTSIALGYRCLGVDYTSSDYKTLDLVNHGPLIGLEIRF
jgi:hypothetical protein